MKQTLQEIAEQYAEKTNSLFLDKGLVAQHFIAGIESNYNKKLIIREKINVLNRLLYKDDLILSLKKETQAAAVISNMRVDLLIKEAQEQLKLLKNE